MKTLIVEDEFTSRLLLQQTLLEYGEVHIAANGREAVEAVTAAIRADNPYDLIYLDIMMPEMNGQEALREIRRIEKEAGFQCSPPGARIIMATAMGDGKNVMAAFREQCDAYLVKPIDRAKLLQHLNDFGQPVSVSL
jgi:two-component system chemotaxis response regulator CheY